MGLTKLVLSFAAPLPKLEEQQRFLFIGPHPDDIEIGAGATAAKLASLGKDIRFLICMDGRFGDEFSGGIKGDALAALRREEAVSSAGFLGVRDVRFLDLCDGGFYEKATLYRAISREIGDFGPDVVFAPDPCVTSECHSDHLNVGEAVRRAVCFEPYPGIMARLGAKAAPVNAIAYYMTAKPNRYVKTSGFLEKQLRAVFEHHLSQFPTGCAHGKAIAAYLKLRAVDYGIKSLKGCAEGFRVLGTTQMHCLPEAGD